MREIQADNSIKEKHPKRVLDFRLAECNSRFMLNKLEPNPSRGLPSVNSVTDDTFFQLLDILESSTDITPSERCTLLIIFANFPKEREKTYIKGLIGDPSTWYRNLKRLEEKGYLVRRVTNEK